MPTAGRTKAPSQEVTVEPFLTAQQLAELIHVRPGTIYERTRRRAGDERIPYFRISRKALLFKWNLHLNAQR
jgi:hypothetical protein